MWLLDNNEVIKSKLTLMTAVHSEKINAENTISFTCEEDVEKLDRVIFRDEQLRWQEFIVQEVFEIHDGIEVYAEHSSYELHGTLVLDKKPTGTPQEHLNVILDNTRWELGTFDGFPSKFISYYRLSSYESIAKMCEVFNAYRTYEVIVVDNKVTKRLVHIKRENGHDLGKRFTYSKDLVGIERTILSGDIVTALYGYGKGEEIGDGYGRRINFGELNKPDSPIGKQYVEDNEARLLYGRNSNNGKVHVESKVEFDDIEDVEELYQATRTRLQELNKPRVNYRAKVELLQDTFENVSIGDYVAIIDNNFRGRSLRLKGKIIKLERDLINVEKSIIEIGNYIDDIADADIELQKFVNQFRDKSGTWDKSNAFDKEGKLEASFIRDLLTAWNDEMNGAGGYVYAQSGGGIITYDKPHDQVPTKVIQIVGGGWRIANRKLSNGEWDWRTVATGDGIHGDTIIAGSITTNQVTADFGASLDLSSNESINLIVKNIDKTIEEIELTPGPAGTPGKPGAPGADGKGIVSTEIRYQKSTSGTETPMGQWQTFIPTVGESEYLWTRMTIKYTTGPDSVSYTIGGVGSQGSKGDTGADGKGIATTVVDYQISESGGAVPTGSWSTTLPPVLPNEYLWTRTTINYTTGSPSVAYSVGRVGKDGTKGDKGDTGSRGATGSVGPRGEDGTSIMGIVEFYGLSTSDTVKPTSWTEIVSEATPLPKMTATQKYLWNYEKINFSNGSNQDTVPAIVGVYGDTGDKGSTGSAGIDGRSIVSINEKYLVTSVASGVTRSTSGWIDTPTATSDTNKYLWNYEIVNWNKAPTPTYIEPIIIGVHGNKGDKGATGATGIAGPKGDDGLPTYTWIAYANSGTGTGISLSPTGKDYVGYASGQTSKTPSITTPSLYTWQLVKGATGEQGIQGGKGEDGKPTYTWIKYADTPTTGMTDDPTDKKYIGMAFNKPTETESTAYGEYQWSLMPQNIEVGGRNLILNSKSLPINRPHEIVNFLGHQGVIKVENPTNAMYINPQEVLSDEVNDKDDYVLSADFTYIGTKGPTPQFYIGGYQPVEGVIEEGRFNRIYIRSKRRARIHMNFLGFDEIYLTNWKLEKGNIATDWTPAPEDIEEDISNLGGGELEATKNTVVSNSAEIQLNADNITNEVTRREELDEALRAEISSQVTQTADDLTVIFNKLKADQALTNDEIALVTSYIRINENGVIIGKSDSAIEFFAENNRVGFRENGQDIAYWEEGTMHVDNLIAIVTVIIGYHQIEKYDSPTQGKTTIVRMSD